MMGNIEHQVIKLNSKLVDTVEKDIIDEEEFEVYLD
jgi:hypothetical protein